MPDKMPATLRALDVAARTSTVYPAELAHITRGRAKRALGDAFGLSQFGVNLTTLEPGASSALRHYHMHEDEFVFVIEGELTLIDDEGEHLLTPGMCAGFKAGVPNGHQLVNRSSKPAAYIEAGTRSDDEDVVYPDVNLKGSKRTGKYTFTRKDGSAY
jgi:uncharacterized cupin superfamily protein